MPTSKLSVYFFAQAAVQQALMAVLSTLMATPLFNWIMRRHDAAGLGSALA